MKNKIIDNVWNFKKLDDPFFDEENYFLDHEGHYKEFKKIINSLDSVKKICDIGICMGSFWRVFDENNELEIHGIDIVPEFLDVAKSRGFHVKICDINKENAPFEDNMFDLVICDSILEHTFKPNHLIKECMRILKPEGYLLLSTPNALSFMMRWNYLRGRNQFWPLIHNLISEVGYLKRCSIFYGLKEIKILFPDKQVKPFFIYEDFWRNRKASIMAKIINLLAKIFPSGRNMLAEICWL